MASEKTDRVIPPAYVPFRTLRGFWDALKLSGIPAKIDRSVLRNRSGAEQTMLLGALAYLGLITPDGTPTASLVELVNADDDNRQKILKNLLITSYPWLFTGPITLQNATPSTLQAAFADAGLAGDTTRKAIVFFLNAAQDAGIPVSPYLKIKQGARGARRRARNGVGGSSGGDVVITPSAGHLSVVGGHTPKSRLQSLMDILDMERMDKDEQEAVWTLVKFLKRIESENSGD